jgi:hypothetical protein
MATYIERVYVAGPLTPRGMRKDTTNAAVEYLYNVKDMIKAGAELIMNGYSPFIPGMDYSLFLVEDITEEQIKGVSMAWLDKSDAVLILPYFENSLGVIAELDRAKELGIPVFASVSDINAYMMEHGRANNARES